MNSPAGVSELFLKLGRRVSKSKKPTGELHPGTPNTTNVPLKIQKSSMRSSFCNIEKCAAYTSAATLKVFVERFFSRPTLGAPNRM